MIHQETIGESIGGTVSCQATDQENSATRREFFTRLRGGAAVTLASSSAAFWSSAEAGEGRRDDPDGSGTERVLESYEIREQTARTETKVPIPKQITNGDEQKYPNFIGNFSKGLPHNSIGEVDPTAYRSYLSAVRQGTAEAFEGVPLGGTGSDLVKLVNPLAGVAFDLEGTDSHQLAIPPSPALASKARAAEAVELYWMALCRDINFTDYATDPTALAAAAELSSLQGFAGPRPRGRVTPQTLFRGFTAEDVIGPYVSQLLLKPFNYGPYNMSGKMSMYIPNRDYLFDQASWLVCQNGQGPFGQNVVDPVPRYIRNGRDFTMFVHTDPLGGLFMSFYNAGMILFQNGAPPNPGNPYRYYKTQSAFGTFGVPFFLGLMGEAAARAFKTAWYAKWYVHRALRPEAFGGLVHMTRTHQAQYPLDKSILISDAVTRVFDRFHSYFLPQAFPEGSPQHPSYPEGHATMAGACATILKAAFDGSATFTTLANGKMKIEMASTDGLSLVPYTGSDAGQITLNGEINKLASNIGQARDMAGIHWRSDSDYGMLLGEAVALSILSDQRDNYAGEDFEGFTITKFDGTTMTI